MPGTGTRDGPSSLESGRGRTTIADVVVAKVAGMAAREVSGVYALGAGMGRALGAVRERLGGGTGTTVTQGVAVEVGETQAAADLNVIAEYGVSIPDLAAGIRRNVIDAIEKLCGLEVTEVNIVVDDLHLPGEEPPPEPQASRVR
ncbi:Asp23/Gls24 family envelope stress response protein [Sphaerisporangium sp. TRM90804]|uniref:Asp23/Gls24 family envelope stress response protein n=1 Tax=Sphaerisporangium sp. TRM90804 TaxID=3031113 RepID=UPI002449D918|nr:Asp23/Gls24 family envelope stress response protein [Sphaerisporangium sp. TRM90804]MDH2424410.1 Asp23/Gls24 family envelope stress response protein [Sphaerisporangium sp. TRM90804]